MKIRHTLAAATFAFAVLATGCSSGSEGDAATSDTTKTTTTTTAAPEDASDATEGTTLCGLFEDIAARAQEAKTTPGDPTATFTPAQWEQKIETTAKIVDVAPVDYKDEAEVYLELVKARSELAAAHDYGVIPTDARTAFMAEHAGLQQESNRLIAYVKETCNLQ